MDDDPLVADVLMFMLRPLGPVICAVSATHATELLAIRLRLAVIDVLMSGRPGIELGAIACAADTPVIFVSGSFDAVSMLRAYGFSGVLQKPQRMDVLCRTAGEILAAPEHHVAVFRTAAAAMKADGGRLTC